MQSHSSLGRKWRRFAHKYGLPFFLACLVGAVMGLLALLLVFLARPN